MNRYLFSIIICFSFSVQLFSNAAQPGIWEAGGTGTFSLLFPEDSLAFRKIRMEKEKVFIQLYRGFAVVKGQYWMYNDTDESIRIKTGYPVNSYYQSEKRNRLAGVYFDELYQLKVHSEGQPVELLEQEIEQPEIFYQDISNWYVWVNEFPPRQSTLIEVYFLVNTNNSYILEGYSKDRFNAFIYLLETGANWKQPIGEGSVFVQLMDGLELIDVKGASPESIFSFNESEKLLRYDFKNLSPSYQDNVILTYANRIEDFDFAATTQKFSAYFDAIEKLSASEQNGLEFLAVNFPEAFEVQSSNWGLRIGMFLIIFGPPILLILLVGIVLYAVIRWWRRKRGN